MPILRPTTLWFSIAYLVLATTVSSLSTMAATPKIKLTYFNIEGAAEPVRLALVLAGVPFEDHRIQHPEWQELKPLTPYGQVPILTVDDKPPMAQSMALLRWIGATYSKDLYPAEKLLAIEEAIGVVEDMKQAWGPCLYMGMAPTNYGHPEGFSKTDEGQKVIQGMRQSWLQNKMPVHMKHLSSLLAKNQGFLASSTKPTIADCVAVPFLRSFTKGHLDYVPTTCLDAYPEIVDYVKRFCALEPIQGRYADGLHE